VGGLESSGQVFLILGVSEVLSSNPKVNHAYTRISESGVGHLSV
jgi:hypothetical protein